MRDNWAGTTIDNLISENGVFCDGDWVESKDQDPNGDVRLIQLADIGDGKFRDKSFRFLTSTKAKELKCTFLNEGDIILARMPDPLGRATIFPLKGESNFVTVVDVAIIRINSEYIKRKYLLYNINNPLIRKEIEALQSGTTRKRISRKNLSKINFLIAPLPEQRAIVTKIEQLFSSLDSGITDLEKAQSQLKIYRQAVLKKAFEGELTKKWREQQTNLPTADELLVQIKEERKNYYQHQLEDWKDAVKIWKKNSKVEKKPGKPKKIKELQPFIEEELVKLPTISKKWAWCKVDCICSHEASSIKAGPFGSSLKKSFYSNSGYKIYGQEQVISGDYKLGHYYVNKDKYNELINCRVKSNDILISLIGTVGKVLILPKDCEKGIINPRLVKISPNSFYSSNFFKFYFESAFLKSLYKEKNHGTTMDVLNLGIIKELAFPFCSKEEQKQIVQQIESRLSVCDKVEQTIKDSLEKAKALRQSILKKAFEGRLLNETELKACKNAPDYEPASGLLKKIQAEKAKKELRITAKKKTIKKKVRKK
jgi:type I restriction enzyme, S subunit